MGIMDTLKGMLGGKADMVTDAIDTAAEKADDISGGKASGMIDGVADKAKDAVEDVADGAPE